MKLSMILCGGSDFCWIFENKSPKHDFEYLYWTISKILFWNIFTWKGLGRADIHSDLFFWFFPKKIIFFSTYLEYFHGLCVGGSLKESCWAWKHFECHVRHSAHHRVPFGGLELWSAYIGSFAWVRQGHCEISNSSMETSTQSCTWFNLSIIMTKQQLGAVLHQYYLACPCWSKTRSRWRKCPPFVDLLCARAMSHRCVHKSWVKPHKSNRKTNTSSCTHVCCVSLLCVWLLVLKAPQLQRWSATHPFSHEHAPTQLV